MKSSLMKLNPVSTFLGEGHLQVLSLCHYLALRITGRNQHLSWIIYEDHIVMF
jgi:hypothetical protein